MFLRVSDFDIPPEFGRLKFTAIEGRCLIKAFQVQIYEALETRKRIMQQSNLTKSGYYLKEIKVITSIIFFKSK